MKIEDLLAALPEQEVTVDVLREKYAKGDECTAEEYRLRNKAAVHFSPDRSRQMIYEGALRAITRFREGGAIGMPNLQPPYEAIVKRRPSADKPASTGTFSHPSSISALINESLGIKPKS